VLTPERNREALAAGIRHCVDRGCAVLSISAGMPFWLPGATGGLGRAVDRAYETGVIVVAAGGQVVDRVCYPGKYDRTIGVGGVTWQRRIWFDYEAGRDRIDVWAPAKDVWRADSIAEPGQTAVPPVEADDPGAAFAFGVGDHGGKLDKGAGTSYATPHVAAAAAMWLLLRGPEIAARYPEPWQRVEAFRTLLKRTASPINGTAPPNGSGILDILALLEAPLPARGGLRKAPEDKDKWA
jgi:subtilisin family serine protease